MADGKVILGCNTKMECSRIRWQEGYVIGFLFGPIHGMQEQSETTKIIFRSLGIFFARRRRFGGYFLALLRRHWSGFFEMLLTK